jgi:hypothetical protein
MASPDRAAAAIAARTDNDVMLARCTPKLALEPDFPSTLAQLLDVTIWHKSYRCFVFFLQHPAVHVMYDDGEAFLNAIRSRCPYMLPPIC